MVTAEWTKHAEALLKAIWAPELDALFWRSDLRDVESAWHGHVPFAHWVVRALAPRCIVELGTHNGVSYGAFCRAVQRDGLDTRCFAIDTWTGDDHAGFYPEEVFTNLRAYHDERFGAFSTLIRRTFDDALQALPDGSIDLLHIDGRHGYDDVRHDFDAWRPKMSSRGVVLFHDTNVRDDGFGVWRLWSELQAEFPSFEFLHAHGLGVLAIGAECPPLVTALAGLRDTLAVGAVRERFAQLGERCVYDAQAKLLAKLANERAWQHDATAARLTTAEADLHATRTELATARRTESDATSDARQSDAARARADQAAAAADRLARDATAELDRHRHAIAAARSDASDAHARLAAEHAAHQAEAARRQHAEAALERILLSTTWRATWPLRRTLSGLPPGLRRPARLVLQSVWRLLTPRLGRRRSLNPPTATPAPLPIPIHIAVPVQTVVPHTRICYVSGEPDTPGTIYRVDRYAAACRASGARVTVLRLDELAANLVAADAIDLLVIWRAVWTGPLEAFVARARTHGARVVFDIDDLMIDPALATVDVIDGIRSQNVSEVAVQAHYTQVQRAMLEADICSASTAELAGHMRRFGKPACTLPNGFDLETLRTSRLAARRRMATPPDGLLRLGYASGSRTHQKDFAQVAATLARVLQDHPHCRLVLFQAGPDVKLVDLAEFPELAPVAAQIEWRDLVPLQRLPEEIARFDVNLAPLQPDNLFCAAKSELKYFEGALAGVCTIASPVGAYARAIRHGETGLLAATPAQWHAALNRLIAQPALRHQMAQTALNEALWTYGPDRRAQLMRRMLAEWQGGPAAADAFVLNLGQPAGPRQPGPRIPGGAVMFSADRLRHAEVTIAVPLHDYAHTIIETLDSVHAQTLPDLDLVIVDDASTDGSLQTALAWAAGHAGRFNRLVVIRNHANAGLGPARNAAFSAAETPYVLPLDADNLLRPGCAEALLAAVQRSGAAFAYPVIQEFGGRDGRLGTMPYDPGRFVGGNYVDAMALVAKSAWSAARGYAELRLGWEDYDFWCAVAEAGLHGVAVQGEPLADYRVHDASMLARVTDPPDTKRQVIAAIEARHPWVSVARPLESQPPAAAGSACVRSSLERLAPILRCPETGQPLRIIDGGRQTADGSRIWPMKAGRPILFPAMHVDDVAEFDHLSNELPESALALIHAATGLVLNLSAGGTAQRFDHVIEAEAAIFRHTTLVADSHALPFADGSFEVVIAMNAFEHYRDPARAAAEIHRVLQPGGQVLIRTAFLQPQHEAPHHFYNATRHGVAAWFAAFDTESLHVSDNFNPSYAMAWMAHECHAALQRDAGDAAARQFAAEPIGRFARFWTDPAARDHPAWQAFAQLSQPAQEAIAAGFEYRGRRRVI